MARTQQQRSAESAERLLVAAVELFGEQGYARTTTTDIAERAGYSREMIRVRYGSKEGLLDSVFEEQLVRRLLPGEEPGGTGLDRALARADGFIAWVRDDPATARSLFVLNFESAGALDFLRPRFRDLYARYEDGLAAALRAGQADGSVRADLDPDVETRLYVSITAGHALRWLMDDSLHIVHELEVWKAWLAAHYAADPR